MDREYGDYEDWGTGDVDLVTLAAHAAVDLDRLGAGLSAATNALPELARYLARATSKDASLPETQAYALSPEAALVLDDAVRTAYSTAPSRSVADVVREAARVAADVSRIVGNQNSSNAMIDRVRIFCVELSRAAMVAVPFESDPSGPEYAAL